MDKYPLYRNALDALLFLIRDLDLVSDSSKIVLKKIVSDVMTEMAKLYDTEKVLSKSRSGRSL